MRNKIAYIKKEPYGKSYESLLRFGQNNCASFSLVWRDQLEFNESAKEIEEKLKPYLIKEEYTNKWPGTEIYDSKAKVRFYKFNSETIKILQEAKSLYNWLSPNMPEDLAFYSKNGKCILESVAHEKDSLIYLEEISFKTMKKEIPELEI